MGLFSGIGQVSLRSDRVSENLSTPEGKVHIDWSFAADEVPQSFTFSWTETGGPPVAPPVRTGFGSRLITKVLAADFDGTVRIEYSPQGVRCVLRSDTGSVTPRQNHKKRS